MSNKIQTADLDWQCIDGIDVPIAKQFGDVYFSKDNGLLEARHVFLAGNDLTARLAALPDYGYFTVAETGFGTGLNMLALWQLWQQQRPNNHSHLHAISIEKFPLTRADLSRALAAWPELAPLAEQLIRLYPLPLAGCHRLNFPTERFSLDLWLGDAQDIFPNIAKTHSVDAWFLDGFAPACNPDMWQENVLDHVVRLSDSGSSFASFSVAGVLKRGLSKHGIHISRPRGFGHKREMLKGIWPATSLASQNQTETEVKIEIETEQKTETETQSTAPKNQHKIKQRHIAVIGAGIAGLNCAWALAQRGHQVQIFDQSAALAGASGNPLALINPMLGAIENSAEHLMTLCWPYALQHYAQFAGFRPIKVNQMAFRVDPEELLGLAEQYPTGVLHRQSAEQLDLATEYDSLQLTEAGVISPHRLAEQILAHPNIELRHYKVVAIEPVHPKHQQQKHQLQLQQADSATTEISIHFEHVLLCCAMASRDLSEHYPVLKPTRGQVSWLNNQSAALQLTQAYSYGGYCMQLDAAQLILGASFCPDREDTAVLPEDHVHNYELIHNVFPQYAERLAPIEQWQGRASVRAQSLDYFPLLGKVHSESEIYTLSALGSKGFLFAPLCSEALAALILGENSPLSQPILNKLNPQRFRKKTKIRKPYYQGPYSRPKKTED